MLTLKIDRQSKDTICKSNKFEKIDRQKINNTKSHSRACWIRRRASSTSCQQSPRRHKTVVWALISCSTTKVRPRQSLSPAYPNSLLWLSPLQSRKSSNIWEWLYNGQKITCWGTSQPVTRKTLRLFQRRMASRQIKSSTPSWNSCWATRSTMTSSILGRRKWRNFILGMMTKGTMSTWGGTLLQALRSFKQSKMGNDLMA